MKKNIIIPLLLSLFIFVGCVEDLPTTSVVEIKPSSTYISLRSSQITLPDDGTEVESITLNSLRILVFDKTSGQIVTNKKFDIETVTAVGQTDGSWVADFSDFVAPTNPGQSVVYAVLNEDVTQVSGQSLTTVLDGVTTLTGMQTLVNTPLTYIPLRVVYDTNNKPIEPPFVMVSFGEVNILPSQLNHADLRGLGGDSKGFTMNRTMAKVTISRVTSEPYTGYAGTTDKVKTSYIHILEMGLVNVPKIYTWSPTTFVPVKEQYQPITFNLLPTGDKFYSRDWTGGSISAKTDVINVVWRQYGKADKRLYKVQNNNGNNSYSTTFNPNITFNDTLVTSNQGGFLSYIILFFGTDDAGREYEGDLIIPPANLDIEVTGAYWTLDQQNISYYIPENILGNKNDTINSTKLHVKAAITTVDFGSEVFFEEDDVTWETEIIKVDGKDVVVKKYYYPGVEIYNNLAKESARFISKKHVIYNDVTKEVFFDESKINVSDGAPYYHFWDGSMFWREARGTVSVSEAGLEFSDPSKSDNIKDFYIPIQNTTKNTDGTETPNGDYNIYRNNEYKFSVHVLEQWPLSAPSGAPSQSSTRSAWEDPNQSMVLRIVPE
ncbi:MAG TPA: hypothetical protein DEB12_03130 [Porphyromonadaceae bacterium]|jgi:hypothetical protein|nr:hypothetical protein [Porphyromonadaceae bacterium]